MNKKSYISLLLVALIFISLISAAYADGFAIVGGSETEGAFVDTNTAVAGSNTISNTTVQANSKPVVTKSPSAEKLDVGGKAVFVAKANNYTSVQWYIVDPNGSTWTEAQNISSITKFKDVVVSGAKNETLVLNNVAGGLAGYQVVAKFSNTYGSTNTAGAFINIVFPVEATEEPSPTPSGSPSPTPTPTPTIVVDSFGNPVSTTGYTGYTNSSGTTSVTVSSMLGTNSTGKGDSNNTTAGVATNSNMPSSGLEVSNGTNEGTNSSVQSLETKKNNHIGAYILAVLAGAVIIGSVLVMALYMKGKINLGKFEQFLGGSDQNINQNNQFRDNGEFYNPDDFNNNNNNRRL